jgi:formiminotetrahydrofolate cyclodeaminase
MASSLWKLTLERFADEVAAGPVPAGVAVSAVAARVALELLAMSLQVTTKRRDSAGKREKIGELLDAAKIEASNMRKHADDDVAAYKRYLKHRKSARARAALRAAIEVPIKVAESALRGLELCAEASSLVSASVAPDLASAAAILGAAARAAARSAEANAANSSDRELLKRLTTERRGLEADASSLIDRIFESMAARLTRP